MYFLWQEHSVDAKIFNFVTLTLTFDLLLKKLNFDYNFWTKRDISILHITIPFDKTFLLIPVFFCLVALTLTLTHFWKNLNWLPWGVLVPLGQTLI